MQAEDLRHHGMVLARQATRGATHAAGEVGLSVGHLARSGILGTLDALSEHPVDPWDVVSGAGYGSVLGAADAGADVGEAAAYVVEGAREAARGLGLPEDEAAIRAAQGALEAADAIGPEAASRVKDALLEELLDASAPESEPGGREDDLQDRQQPHQ